MCPVALEEAIASNENRRPCPALMDWAAALFVVVWISAAPVLHGQDTVTWTGAIDSRYSEPLNWEPNVVPLNDMTHSYRVIIPNNVQVNFDVPGMGHELFQLVIGTGATLAVNPGRDLRVSDEASVSGSIVVDNSRFEAISPAVLFSSSQAYLGASSGGTLRLAATTLRDTVRANDEIFSASGQGTLLDLSSLVDLSFGPTGGRYFKTISARTGARIDLSRLQALGVATGEDDVLDVVLESGGRIDLNSLASVNSSSGNGSEFVRFLVRNGLHAVPSLQVANNTQFRVATGARIDVGDQTLQGSELRLAGQSYVTLEPGATWNAPNLVAAEYTWLTGGTVDSGGGDNIPLSAGSVVNAPRLTNVRRSTINISDSATLVIGQLSQIDDLRLWVSGGMTFDRVVDTDYLSTNWWGDTDLIRANDPGTLIDLSSLTTMTFGHGSGRYTRYVRAGGGATIDLSGLQSVSRTSGEDDPLVFEVRDGSALKLDSLRSINSTDGSTNGFVKFDVSGATQTLPSLRSARSTFFRAATGSVFNVGDQTPNGADLTVTDLSDFVAETGAVINAPNLVAADYTWFTGGSVSSGRNENLPIATGAVINAPRLTSVRRSTINISDNATLVTDQLSQIDDLRLWVSGGMTFDRVVDTDYLSTNWWGDTDLIRANDPGTLIDLSSLTTMTFGQGSGRYTRYIRAGGGATIDLSGLQSTSRTSGEDDPLVFEVRDGSALKLDSLRSINATDGSTNGFVKFDVLGGTQTLPSLRSARSTFFRAATGSVLHVGDQTPNGADLTVTDLSDFVAETGAVINAPNLVAADYTWFTGGAVSSGRNENLPIATGAVINAPRLTSVRRSTINISDSATLVTGQLSQIDDLRLWVSGGMTFDRVVDTDYLSTSWWGDTDLIRANDPGTLIDLSSLTTMTFGHGSGRYTRYIRAGGGATIDLSGLQSTSRTSGEDDPLVFEVRDGSALKLDSLRSINATDGSTNGFVKFDVLGATQTLPSLRSARSTFFRASTGSVFNVGDHTPNGTDLTVTDLSDFVAETGAVINAPNLVAADYTWFTGGSVSSGRNENLPIATGAVINAPRLTSVRRSTINISDNATLVTGQLSQIDDLRLWVSGGITFDRVVDTDYVTTSTWGGTKLFEARGEGTKLDLSSLQNLSYGNVFGRYAHTIEASDGALIDLSNLRSITNLTGQDDELDFYVEGNSVLDLSSLAVINPLPGNGNERVRFYVREQGHLHLGNLAVTNRTELHATHISSKVDVHGSLFIESTGVLSLAEGANLSIRGDLLFRTQDENALNMGNGIVHLNGEGIQFVEAGGLDGGVSGNITGNFGIGRLVVGTDEQPTTAMVLDLLNNGNRGTNSHEALYLGGVGGLDGLELAEGSILVLNGINLYARQDGSMLHLNSLFGDELIGMPMGAGFLAAVPPIAGDANFDGVVNELDLDVLMANLFSGDNLHWTDGDFNFDGLVDVRDVNLWNENKYATSSRISLPAVAVPEPRSCLLLFLAGLGLSSITRRRFGRLA